MAGKKKKNSDDSKEEVKSEKETEQKEPEAGDGGMGNLENGKNEVEEKKETTIQEIVDSHVADSPKPNEQIIAHLHAKDSEKKQEEKIVAENASVPPNEIQHKSSVEQKDSSGVNFDPSVHDTDESGKPKLTKTGKFRKRRKDSPNAAPTNPQTNASERYETTGKCIAGLFTMICTGYFGEHFTPQEEERKSLENSFTEYCRIRQVPDLPPEIALCGAIVVYFAPRWSDGRTREKFAKIPLIGKLLVRSENAQSDSRSN